MSERRWYTEPETFVAVAALIVSISAVAVGLYEASLQRAHDRAEVWPHVELSVLISPEVATLSMENTGIGPAIIKSMVVTVDGVPQQSWPAAIAHLLRDTTPGAPPPHTIAAQTSTVVDRALRPGDKVVMIGVPAKELPPGFWQTVSRLSVVVCYQSVFEDAWTLTDARVGGASAWKTVKTCPAPAAGTDF